MTRCLVVLVGSAQALSQTFDSLSSKVLAPLGAELALFSHQPFPHKSLTFLEYDWRVPEPPSWEAEFLRFGLDNTNIGRYSAVHEQFFSGVGPSPYNGNSAISYFQKFRLGHYLRQAAVMEKYDWILMTRPDFLWFTPIPRLENFDASRIYFLSGEHYSGVEDRFLLFSRHHWHTITRLYDRIFQNPPETLEMLKNLSFVNPEVYLWTALKQENLQNSAEFIPYLGALIRPSWVRTSRPGGEWDSSIGAFLKYPAEKLQAQHYSKFISSPTHWGGYPGGLSSARLLVAHVTWRVKLVAWETRKLAFSFLKRGKNWFRRRLKSMSSLLHRVGR